jgi:hypothetical protein
MDAETTDREKEPRRQNKWKRSIDMDKSYLAAGHAVTSMS